MEVVKSDGVLVEIRGFQRYLVPFEVPVGTAVEFGNPFSFQEA